MKYLIGLMLLLTLPVCWQASPAYGQGNSLCHGDSMAAMQQQDSMPSLKWTDRMAQSRLYQATHVGVPLIVGGLVATSLDKPVHHGRNDLMPHFHCAADDYLRFVPAAVMVGLKVAGVPSRSPWDRMLLSDATSTALMSATLLALKHSVHVRRPDGSDRQSFPSGHTAAAFMTATMLSKEYGHLSPWVGIGGYGVATMTGLMRIANDKHWLSDVIVGAGIGILATEFGYWLTDVLFKGHGKKKMAEK